MELDADVSLNNLPRSIALELAKRFPVEFSKKDAAATHQDVVIRFASAPQVVTDVDAAVQDFLRSLVTHADAIKRSCGVLRLGVFYDLSETVVFPLQLSAETIRTLGELNLGIDATGYPCAEESEED
jgi:hypothetical protein